ncbi:glycosyltransferase [Niameybacter massiliensis]|uniref:Glycosyltransferase n=1 Tax=Holtiella tumoricola TaxID=3018743 RepID=A0AA42J2M0_9FIRM|nr:glycosyltransferase [Holtiella tumoricola]MDA3733216.1 glycosyltransferase [Holtiella tumoricola]
MKILYFSTVNWKWIKQRPHFIAEGLADEGIEVEYISLTPFFKQKIDKFPEANKNVFVNDKYVIPLASKISLIETINRCYIQNIIDKPYDVIIITHPIQYQYLKKTLEYNPRIIYDCMDNIPYFYEKEYRNKIIELENEICKKVDNIIVSSFYLKDKMINQYGIEENKITVICNAVARDLVERKYKVIPEEWILKKKNIVYIGTIGKWLDIDLLIKYAIANKDENIYLIGPKENELKVLPSNIYLLPPIEHKYIVSIIEQAEILIIPFKSGELIDAVDPVKIYEYKSLNKYVLCSRWKEMIKHEDDETIYFYEDLKEFEAQMHDIRTKNIQNITSLNKCYIEQNNWDKRVEKYLEVVFKLCN